MFLVAMCSVSMTVDWVRVCLGWGFVKRVHSSLRVSEWALSVCWRNVSNSGLMTQFTRATGQLHTQASQFPHPQNDLPRNPNKNNGNVCQNSHCQLRLQSILTLGSPVYASTHNNYLFIFIKWQNFSLQCERYRTQIIRSCLVSRFYFGNGDCHFLILTTSGEFLKQGLSTDFQAYNTSTSVFVTIHNAHNLFLTRMHSSRMRTVRNSSHLLGRGGGCLVRWGLVLRGVWYPSMHCGRPPPPWTEWQTGVKI